MGLDRFMYQAPGWLSNNITWGCAPSFLVYAHWTIKSMYSIASMVWINTSKCDTSCLRLWSNIFYVVCTVRNVAICEDLLQLMSVGTASKFASLIHCEALGIVIF
ncbi:hypothetical protein BABINDRAFT_138789 [Babjeviella inositovora NRRL Y-12698]|uniref:Uncharacterized protein n=1 Tax=Babjeviella inositovora NRRL Y-12698 TaxID=984486 RepID=A0A1E3QRA8_9ASCO|nr:uncharacterized protein BABINDRAFT_138789 [Babjeviella inositovora NRRL Y-12698]ODQ80024.1 hypothetical protein BABINDRAFT_138789 [Babjeviella inositovora NRRL Y-12698]